MNENITGLPAYAKGLNFVIVLVSINTISLHQGFFYAHKH